MKRLLQKIRTWRSPQFLRKFIHLIQTFIFGKNLGKRKGKALGFTLIELLVASLIAASLVTVLLTFLVGVLDSDRKESAKSKAQEELQAAINYIADDLQEALYVYGSEGLCGTAEGCTSTPSLSNPVPIDGIFTQLPHNQSGTTGNECYDSTNPTINRCTPILAFWKRYTYDSLATGKYTATVSPQSQTLGCMPYKDTTNCTSTNTALNPYKLPYAGNRYVYSLIVYYLKNDRFLNSTTWSNTARILRWEMKDGYVWFCSTGGSITDTTNCPTTTASDRKPNLTSPYIVTSTITGPPAVNLFLADTNKYFIIPAPGFNRVDFSSSGTLTSIAKTWQKFDNFKFAQDTTVVSGQTVADPNDKVPFSPFVTLVDFMDDTAYASAQGGGSTATGTGSTAQASAGINIPIGKNVASNSITGVVSPSNPDCDDASVGLGNPNAASATNTSGAVTQRIPVDFASATSNPSGLTSFYACVSPESTNVRVFLRGNALARLSIPFSDRQPNQGNQSFFPTANVRSFGRSDVGIKLK